jgi:uroporphyrin-III C-methyltransferase/precorrin-2 dehydrogenase/sirohydrochlorin ferrochelatase
MNFLPIFLNIRGMPCTVVGGGEVATRKVALLRDAGARVTVVAPVLVETLAGLARDGLIVHVARAFQTGDVSAQHVVIAATDDKQVNRAVAQACHAQRIPVNVVDTPELCSFVMPSIVDRSPLLVAVSTGGASPVLARLIRTKLETIIPVSFGRLARLAGTFRDKVKARFAKPADRRVFWESVLEGPIAEMVYAGREADAEAALEKAIEKGTEARGEVFLVGGGPGDPDLLTFRALRLMQQADVIVYDRLVSPEVLALTRRDAQRIYAGKERSKHAIPQEDINALLVRLAREGKRVVRLKGGDPFIFGRGGEEIATLAQEGIPFQVVPGITAAAGCAAYAGIPLTQRGYATSVVFATGSLRDGTINLNWEALAHPDQTVVFYMGLHGVPTICRELIAHGMPPSTPAALVQQGTTPSQRVYASTLESLPEVVAREEVHAPTLIIVGDVVKLRDTLRWFEPVSDTARDA